jgi:hypothetical protein
VFSPSDYGDEEIRRRKQENALDECDQTVVRTIWNVRESLGIRLSPCRQEDVADIVGPEAVAYMQQKSGGPMIYAVRGMTPLRAAFEDRRRIQKQQKVRRVFHGSTVVNWLSILRYGIRPMSGTRYQSSGNVYGNGIYVSDSIATSMMYSTGTMQIIAVCDLIDDPALYNTFDSCKVVTDASALLITHVICM